MTEALKLDKERLWEVHPPEVYKGKRSLIGLAYHEAGHAVLGRMAKVPFSAVVIQHRKGEDFTGFVGSEDVGGGLKKVRSDSQKLYEPLDFPESDNSWVHKALAFRHCCFHLAGMQAELLLHSVEPDPPLIRHDTDHSQAAAKLHAAFGCSDLYYPQMVTRNYLSQCWGEVKRIAEELLARHEQHGIGIMKRDDPRDVSFFSRQVAGAEWVDEKWD
jgi:hypothetical protein